MWAILSDVHANLEALQAVLADIERQKVERLFCLGDMVGYGPDPLECLNLIVARCEVVLMGNFDLALLMEPDDLIGPVQEMVRRDRARLGETSEPNDVRRHHLEMIRHLPRLHREREKLWVHGSPRNPLNEYVFPEDIYNRRKMQAIFELIEEQCFVGHTHFPGVFVEEGEEFRFEVPAEIENVHRFDGRKTIVNVGSVGQPRDGDWRACYVLYDNDTVRFRRVEYDLETTIGKIHNQPDGPGWMGDRLRDGR